MTDVSLSMHIRVRVVHTFDSSRQLEKRSEAHHALTHIEGNALLIIRGAGSIALVFAADDHKPQSANLRIDSSDDVGFIVMPTKSSEIGNNLVHGTIRDQGRQSG